MDTEISREERVALHRERVRDFIYDCTKDESNTGWTLSAEQADRLIAIAALEPNERLIEALTEARELIMQVNHEEGYCMCGIKVEDHGFGDGHSPVDAGAYAMQQVVERIDAALSTTKADQ